MRLKTLIKRDKIRKAIGQTGFDTELTLPGEPLIYSIKYSIGYRTKKTLTYFRNQKFKSIIKCIFPSYMRSHIPVVLLVRFFVSVPPRVSISAKDLAAEKTEATHAYELCDYLLSFLEMLFHVLFNTYKQVVKIDCEKYYSKNPRTVFKFMRYDQYVNLQNSDTVHTEAEAVRKNVKAKVVQPDSKRHETDKRFRRKSNRGAKDTSSLQGSTPDNTALQDTSTKEDERSKEGTPTS